MCGGASEDRTQSRNCSNESRLLTLQHLEEPKCFSKFMLDVAQGRMCRGTLRGLNSLNSRNCSSGLRLLTITQLGGNQMIF